MWLGTHEKWPGTQEGTTRCCHLDLPATGTAWHGGQNLGRGDDTEGRRGSIEADAGGVRQIGAEDLKRRADDAEVIRVEAVFGGVGPEEADGRLAVLDLSGEQGLATEAVVNGGDGVATFEMAHGRVAAGLAAALPSAAVDPDDQRQRAIGLSGAVEVKFVAFAMGAVFEVALDAGAFGESGLGRQWRREGGGSLVECSS